MDREEMNQVLQDCPIRVTMNDGSAYEIPDKEMALCSDIKLMVLHKRDDGKWGTVHLPLVTIAKIEVISPAA